MRFSKYHGTGNDFVMIEDLDDRLDLSESLGADLCDRHLGVGADGVIRIAPSERGAFFMDYRNADGQVAEMCGNGIRCLAKYVFDRGLWSGSEIDVETRAGVKHLVLETRDGVVTRVRVDMGSPTLERRTLPMTGPPDETFVDRPFTANGADYRATAVSMGNPHLVLVGAELDALDLPRVGPPLEHHQDFPERTNVEFIDVEDGVVNVRVWERGSGETMACGTGACASLVAAHLMGLSPRRATVRFPGGDIDVEWTDAGTVLMTGSAEHVFDGELADAWVARRLEGART